MKSVSKLRLGAAGLFHRGLCLSATCGFRPVALGLTGHMVFLEADRVVPRSEAHRLQGPGGEQGTLLKWEEVVWLGKSTESW